MFLTIEAPRTSQKGSPYVEKPPCRETSIEPLTHQPAKRIASQLLQELHLVAIRQVERPQKQLPILKALGSDDVPLKIASCIIPPIHELHCSSTKPQTKPGSIRFGRGLPFARIPTDFLV